MKRILLAAVCAMVASVACGQSAFVTLDPGQEAWWVRARFNPRHTQVRGIPVVHIREDWCKASEFTRDAIPRELLNEGGSDIMAEVGFGFAVQGRFDRSKTSQVALTGVYETCGGERGSFLLILDKGTQRVRFLDAQKSAHQFAALKADGSTIRVAYCMECDVGATVRWDPGRMAFRLRR
jgi:hypothetical protein